MRFLNLLATRLGAGTLASAAVLFGLSAAHATTYSGNGDTGFGGPIGLATLALTDDGTIVSGNLTKGTNGLNDVLVIYIDSIPGGFADTSGFADGNDGLRRSISGFDGGSNRSLLTFPVGFSPDYAIALGPQADSFGGLWQLANGGGNSLPFVNSVNLSPTGGGTANSANFTFSFNLSDIGSPSSFTMLGTYTSDSGFRSTEAIAGNDTGTQGWNPFLGTGTASYTPVPEPSSMVLLGLASIAGLRRRRR